MKLVRPMLATLSTVPLHPKKPTALVCHTIKGRGVPFVEKNLEWHHKNRLTDEELQALLAALEDE